MALRTQKGSDLPEGAVAVSADEALNYQWNFIKNWPSEAEVLSIKFGRHIACATTLFSSSYLINFFRKTLNITKLRFMVAVMPGVLIPSSLTYFTTDAQITNSVLLMKLSCPICNQLKFAVTQLYLSIIFPVFYGYGSLSGFASLTGSAPVPFLKTHPKEFWRYSFQVLKQGIPHYQVVGLVQTVLILFLPYFQNKQLVNVMNKSRENYSESLESDLELKY